MIPPTTIERACLVVRQFVDAWNLPLDATQAAELGAYILEWFEWKPNDSNYPRTRPGAPRGSTPRLPLNPEDIDVIVVLAACHAGQVAPYLHAVWSLPVAFVEAGARAVLASPAPIHDAEAGPFFEAVLQRIRAGQPPASALRDERVAWLGRGVGWVREVLLFE